MLADILLFTIIGFVCFMQGALLMFLAMRNKLRKNGVVKMRIVQVEE